MLPRDAPLRVLTCLLLFFHLAGAAILSPVRRQEDSAPSTTIEESISTTNPDAEEPTNEDKTQSLTESVTESDPDSTPSEISPTSITVTTSVPTLIDGSDTDIGFGTVNNATIEEGQLPLEPRVTPGFGVAGVILLITGVGYALIGIKNRWVHTFLSTAYLGALGTTILIVYLMPLPVSDGIQGAYVVAAVLTGVILGGGACVFKEITESLGCVLGGFCFSMWLLTLADGGLVKASGSKAIFIAAFTAGSFATYFSQYTRAYGLIASIAFSGATVVVLGIDCFSRAGLKEFWAYIWELNEDLFPLGADTYPITKGIRAETAIIIIVFIVGIVSQMRLWKVIKEHRDKREEERKEGQRNLQEEEEAVGRTIEQENARERRQWEATYGDGEGDTSANPSKLDNPDGSDMIRSGDSGVGSLETEKKTARNSTQSIQNGKKSSSEEAIEMSDLPRTPEEETPQAPPKPKEKAAAEMITTVNQNGILTVRVATDEMPNGAQSQEDEQKVWVVRPDGNSQPVSFDQGKELSREAGSSPMPVVAPLPFRIPTADEDDSKSIGHRSSVATFADDVETEDGAPKRRRSMANRLSQGSATLLRKLSQATMSRVGSPIPTAAGGEQNNESNEDLIIPRHDPEDDDRRSSLAATIDDLSSDGDVDSVRDARPISIEINAELAQRMQGEVSKETNNAQRPVSSQTLSTYAINPSDAVDEKVSAVGKSGKAGTTHLTPEEADSKKARSTVSVESTPMSLTKEKLPRALSRIALSYRTNEWAKHLGHAETPQPDALKLNEYPEEEKPEKKESAAPVDVDDLQLTAETGTPQPLTRLDSTASATGASRPQTQPKPRLSTLQTAASASVQSLGSPTTTATSTGPYPTASRNISNRRVSTDVVNQPIAEEGTGQDNPITASPSGSGRNSTSVERPPVAGIVSFSSPQTLIGQRDMLLRNKSMLSVASASGIPGVPDISMRPPSEAGSIYNYPTTNPYQKDNPYAISAMDVDDLPLSQRREIMMRQTSLQALAGGTPSRPTSAIPSGLGQVPAASLSTPALTADAAAFNSHQPQRGSTLPTQAARDAQLASFRQSVATDLRQGASIVPNVTNSSNPYTNGSLLGGGLLGGSIVNLSQQGEASVRNSINTQRSMLLSEKQAENARKEAERANRDRVDRAFEERMRSGELLGAHRDAMRRMQGKNNS